MGKRRVTRVIREFEQKIDKLGGKLNRFVNRLDKIYDKIRDKILEISANQNRTKEELSALSQWYAKNFEWDLYFHGTTRHDISDRLARLDYDDGDEIRGFNWRWGIHQPYRKCERCKYMVKCKYRTCGYKTCVINPLDKIDIRLVQGYWNRLISAINRRLYGNNYKRKRLGVSWVIGLETWNGQHTHLHGLIGGAGVSMLCRKCIQKYWEWFTGLRSGMSRVEPFDKKRAVRSAFYLAKHQIKQRNVVDFFVKRTQNERENIEERISIKNQHHKDTTTGLLHLYYGKRRACEWGDLLYKEHQCIRKELNKDNEFPVIRKFPNEDMALATVCE